MLRRLFVVSLLALGASVAASCATPAPEPQSQPQTTRYELARGSAVGIVTGTDGKSTVTVKIPPGSPGAGEYVSTADALVEAARDAQSHSDDPGAVTVIEVDGAGRLIAIEHKVTVPAK